jgi:GT2 family glycosyltransferase
MRIAVYTLTRDRIEYTKVALESLRHHAGADFSHFIVDQGSADGSVQWIREHYKPTWFHPLRENIGIARGANMALDAIFEAGTWDLVIKMDNDCEVQSDNILRQFVEIFADVKRWQSKFALSPKVDGIMRQPERKDHRMLAGRRIGITGMIGGLFHVVPGEVYKEFRYHEQTPRGGLNDSYFCDWFRRLNGGEVGYVEGLVVSHIDGTEGQVYKHPDYTERKKKEMEQDISRGLGQQTA